MATVEERLATLEAAVAALEEQQRPTVDGRGDPPPSAGDEHGMWILEGLEHRVPDGAVAFAGHLPSGPLRWQWGRTTSGLMAEDWEPAASTLAALGHPVRLRLLQLVLSGVASTAELAHSGEFGTTGQLHHHLRTLASAGWIRTVDRGRHVVPPTRVIPLLAIIAAATGG